MSLLKIELKYFLLHKDRVWEIVKLDLCQGGSISTSKLNLCEGGSISTQSSTVTFN